MRFPFSNLPDATQTILLEKPAASLRISDTTPRNFVSKSRHEAVFHLRDKDELLVFVNTYEQRIEPVSTGNVTANDELLLSVRAVLDPGT